MAVDTLAVRVSRAIRIVRREKEACVALDRPVGQPDLERRTEVDAAAAFAAAKGWLAFGDEAANFALLMDRAP
ncbi:MAG TPA: hypothetical protein VK634_00305 [Reyranella sp.]|nr:hypothetical protein [Reyranella sp.]